MTPANFLVPFGVSDIKAVHAGQASIGTVISVMTSHTCGENCWHAKELVCRCSCGGANHGCLLVDGAEQPVRTKRIDGRMYQLEAVDVKTWDVDDRLKAEYPPKLVPETMAYYQDKDTPGFKKYWPTYQTIGSPLRAKAASRGEIEKWPELAAYRNRPAYHGPVYVLWKLVG